MNRPAPQDEQGPRVPDPRMGVAAGPRPPQIVFRPAAPAPPEPADPMDPDADSMVRPFIVTGGRTRPTDERLRVETLVTAAPAALSAPLGFERRRIVEACQRPLSVAEVAACLAVPIGVARVLIADLIVERLVTMHEHLGFEDRPSLALLERIRDGVRAL